MCVYIYIYIYVPVPVVWNSFKKDTPRSGSIPAVVNESGYASDSSKSLGECLRLRSKHRAIGSRTYRGGHAQVAKRESGKSVSMEL